MEGGNTIGVSLVSLVLGPGGQGAGQGASRDACRCGSRFQRRSNVSNYSAEISIFLLMIVKKRPVRVRKGRVRGSS